MRNTTGHQIASDGKIQITDADTRCLVWAMCNCACWINIVDSGVPIFSFVNSLKISSLKERHKGHQYYGLIILLEMLLFRIPMKKQNFVNCFKIPSWKRRLQAQSWPDCSKQRHNTFQYSKGWHRWNSNLKTSIWNRKYTFWYSQAWLFHLM